MVIRFILFWQTKKRNISLYPKVMLQIKPPSQAFSLMYYHLSWIHYLQERHIGFFTHEL